MATTAIATLHDGWDCIWSRPGRRLEGVPESQQPERARVCVREGHRRNVGDAECRTCAYFEPLAESTAHATEAGILTAATGGRALAVATRGVLVLTAIFFVAVGVVTLTGPLTIPFTVTMWLCAAMFSGLAVFWRLPGA